MKSLKIFGALCALGFGTVSLCGQEAVEVEQLRRQLKQLQEQFERQLLQQREQIDSLSRQLDALQKRPTTNAPPVTIAAPAAPSSAAPVQTPTASTPSTASTPLRLSRGPAYIDLSLDALITAGATTAGDIDKLQPGGHDPKQRGFTLQNFETIFSGAVDPFLRAQANVVFQIDSGGASRVEVEEAFAETTSLPGNFQVRAGQFLTDFGRINTQHPHGWNFVDAPLVSTRLLGGDGLRGLGARVSWLVPTPFYSELFLGVQNSQGETAFSFRNEHDGALFAGRRNVNGNLRSAADLLFTPRYQASFDLTDTQTLIAGASAALGPNSSGSRARTEIFGADLFWKWKPENHSGGFPFVSWQTEALVRRYEAAAFSNAGDDLNSNGVIDGAEANLYGDGLIHSLPRETLTDYGFYSQLAWGFRKGWIAGLRGEWISGDRGRYESLLGALDKDRAERWRISPNLTWLPSEFSKLRLQYNYDDRRLIGVDHSVWLQFEFSLGAHAAHKF